MTAELPTTTRQLTTTVTGDAVVRLAIQEAPLRELGPDDVLVKVGAAPINPSDLGLMFAGADMSGARNEGDDTVAADIGAGMGALGGRLDQSLPCGNEGGGEVIATGSSAAAEALAGKVVGFISGDAYAEYRVLHHSQCLGMPDGTTSEQAAAWFVNPLTALGMVETMRREGHTALVHTVGASNLGQMLNRICLDDGVALVNIVRRAEHVELLKGQGAEHVVNSSSDTFEADLAAALTATGATIAFDAIGGGKMAGTLLAVMEQVASAGQEYSRYGSDTKKQVYIYGRLDTSPIVMEQRFGLSWSLGGWLLTPFLGSIGQEAVDGLRQRVANEISTTFASEYGTKLSLEAAVDADQAKAYAAMATGEKALVTPHA